MWSSLSSAASTGGPSETPGCQDQKAGASAPRLTAQVPRSSVHMEWPAQIAYTWVTPRERHRATGERSRPGSKVKFVGLDVHAESIAVAVLEPDGELRSLGIIPNRHESVRKLVRKLGPVEHLRVCYEAGPTGYVLYWQLVALGVKCDVIAPSLVPVKPGDRVKTDRRDAAKLARSYRAGDLTPVWVPDAAHEALRDLVRAREVAKRDQLRARHRLSTFLLRTGWQRPAHLKTPWSKPHLEWIKMKVHFDQPAQEMVVSDYVHEIEHVAARIERLEAAIHEAARSAPPRMCAVIAALQALRGVAEVAAVTIVAELGTISRFSKATQLMGYSGLVPSEFSSGKRCYRGSVTKSGNAHLRRVIVEAAWAYQFRPWCGGYLLKRQVGLSEEIKEIGWKAQNRLHLRYRKLLARGKNKPQIVTAVGRELLGFIWAIGSKVEAEFQENRVAA
jgi:transposase